MADQSPFQRTAPAILDARPKPPARIHKFRYARVKSTKRMDGLLNTVISPSSHLMQIAQRNSIESPLLGLPGKIRDKIWRYALGDHQVDIQDLSQEEPVDSIFDLRTLYPDTLCQHGFVRPSFQLPKVCRQIYVEASPYMYTMNTFAFHSIAIADRWIKNRRFRAKYPNIQRIGIDNWTLFCDYDEIRRLPGSKGKGALDMWVEAKAKIIAEVQKKEGRDVCVEWHGQSA
ncbi:hypothetical protein E8E12_005299 [Didymella heteroderae]|uniref:DUF7730 domain-containing protein n=1 Tax=Didymella heteroderae TaxID=1769908 RepID=A0A9P5C1F0_9PLEO|nr:hypothetical protein E8E12_005299 [Didymella heteroderae]